MVLLSDVRGQQNSHNFLYTSNLKIGKEYNNVNGVGSRTFITRIGETGKAVSINYSIS